MKFIILNWKNFVISSKEIENFFSKTGKFINKASKRIKLIICPSFVFLTILDQKRKKYHFLVGAQDVFYEPFGAYTGQVSPLALKNLGVKYIILGHSEKRKLGENIEIIRKKIKTCLKYSLIPIVCLGEENRENDYFNFIKDQIEKLFKGFSKKEISRIIIAYEPVWAINSKKNKFLSAKECEEMFIFIRKILASLFDEKVAKKIQIIYGGSVNTKNIKDYFQSKEIKGVLLGRSGTKSETLKEILSLAIF